VRQRDGGGLFGVESVEKRLRHDAEVESSMIADPQR
jgi:hypothetical protein